MNIADGDVIENLSRKCNEDKALIKELRDKLYLLLSALDKTLDALHEVVYQSCSRGDGTVAEGPNAGQPVELDSMAISAYAYGLRTLAEYKRGVEILDDAGRRVLARSSQVKPIEEVMVERWI